MNRMEWRKMAGRLGAVLLGTTLALLQGCGGGGGGGGASADGATAGADQAANETPSAPATPDQLLSNWFLQVPSDVQTREVQLDANGNVNVAGTTYTYQAGGPSGCTVKVAGSAQEGVTCAAMGGGNVYAMCQPYGTVSRFGMLLFKRDAAQVVSYRELAGRQLRLTVCDSRTSTLLTFSADGTTARSETPGNAYSPSMARNLTAAELDALTSTTGVTKDGQVERWVVYRVNAGGAPSYFLVVLHGSAVEGVPPNLPTHLYLPE